MKSHQIISRAECMQILRKDLRKAALESRAAELQGADVDRRQGILNEIENDIEKEVRRRMRTSYYGDVLY
jgi:hypothetical protein